MKLSKRIFSAIIALIMISTFSNLVFAGNYSVDDRKVSTISTEESSEYLNYLDKNSDYADAKSEVVIEMDKIILENSNLNVEIGLNPDAKKVVNFTNVGDTATFEFDVEESGFYNLQLEFLYLDDGVADLEMAVKIDNEVRFDDMNNFKIPRLWKNSSDEWMVDDQGNQYSPDQTEIKGYNKTKLYDRVGVATEPYKFALSKGKHTVSITVTKQEISLSEISFTAPEQYLSYSDVSTQYSKNGYRDYMGDDIVIQGEDADVKNSFSIIGKSDNLSPAVIPNNAKNTVVNYIGASNWSNAGETILWNFNAPESGLYEICFHYKQSEVVNGSVYRWLKIDGKTPFTEATSIRFNYSTSWDICTLLDSNGENCKIYLEKGPHTIELAVTVGEMSNYYIKLKEIVDTIANEYLKIAMITGETPDANRDYELFRQIPTLEKVFNENIGRIADLVSDMKAMSEKSSTQYVSSLNAMSRVLNQMLDNKYLAHTYKNDLYTQYCTLSSMLYEMLVMPLSLDEIRLHQPGKEVDYDVTIFESMKHGVLKFIYSFMVDYSVESEDDESITLWINWGRDQTQILKTLIQESFTPKTDIDVNVKITGATIIQGMLTDNAPDVAIGVSRANPVNYAMREAVYNLKNFDDFETITKRFTNDATKPYAYKEGIYALPDTQNFFIMFYRKDILDSLGISVPKTWDEFIEATSVIQRNKMNVYLPYTKLDAPTTVNSGIGGLNLFATLMIQNDFDFYDMSNYNSLLDRDHVIDLFDKWTQYYTKYKVPTESNFYNRFRIGVTPLGIAPYTTYTTLDVAAPEIKGKWGISVIPGTLQSDGNINYSSAGSGTACIILNDSKNKDNAWEFLKWWTSFETQLSYSRNVESIIGPTGRIATSNTEAFLNYSWNDRDLEILLEQSSHVEEIPEVPGSYYLVRAVDQAFWSVVNGKSNASDAMIKWNAVSNDEIQRKVEEYKSNK